MKVNFKKLLNLLFIIASVAVIVVIAFSDNEMANAWEALFSLDLMWLLILLASWASYVFFDALSLYIFVKQQGYPITLRFALYLSFAGIYYANLVPGGGGGEPFQIYYMNKRGVPVGIGTSAITIRLFCMQFMVIFTGLVLWLFCRDAMAEQVGEYKWIIIIGGIINFSVVPLLLLAAFYRPPVQALANWCIRMGTKLRLIKNPEFASLRVDSILDTYHASTLRVSKAPGQVLLQMLCMSLSMLGLLFMPVAIYNAFGLSGTPWIHILAISYFVFWSSSYSPTPGAAGMQEGGFLVFYAGIFNAGTIGLALLICRFMNFYIFMLAGPPLTVGWSSLANRRQKGLGNAADAVEEVVLDVEESIEAEADAPVPAGYDLQIAPFSPDKELTPAVGEMIPGAEEIASVGRDFLTPLMALRAEEVAPIRCDEDIAP